MASYTIEDVELIRRKSGISYQEAVALLDYHNGNLARALVDLERNGRIRPDAETAQAARASRTASGGEKPRASKGSAFVEFVSSLYRARLKISKDDTAIVNLSALFCIACALFAPHMVIAGGLASLVLGYRFAFKKNDPDFAGENLERMVRSAADNVRTSVNDFTRGFQAGASGGQSGATGGAGGSGSAGSNGGSGNSGAKAHTAHTGPQAHDPHSYYTHRPAATHRSVPTMNVPVQVESQDGSVTVERDGEGYASATIE